MNMTVERTVKSIKEALENNCLYVYIARPAGSGNNQRVINARKKSDRLQVKKIDGMWVDVTEYDSLYQQ